MRPAKTARLIMALVMSVMICTLPLSANALTQSKGRTAQVAKGKKKSTPPRKKGKKKRKKKSSRRHASRRRYSYAKPVIVDGKEIGMACYYAKRVTGCRTASGERLDNNDSICAHKTHPFGTRLRVTNLSNGKSVVVRVIDRGPYGRGKIIDISYSAAQAIDMIGRGTAKVSVEVVE